MRPVILLTGGCEPTQRNMMRFTLYKNYADAIGMAGGIPILCTGNDEEGLRQLADQVSGLFLTGGGDIRPSYYGQEEERESSSYDDWRDSAEITLCRLFIEREKPILGVCRGFQVINVAFSGTVYGDIEKELNCPHPDGVMHAVEAVPGSWWDTCYGRQFFVNSFHHQAVKRLGTGLKPSSYDRKTGIVESFAHEHLPVMGVQWHPERMAGEKPYTPGGPDMGLYFKKFIEMCGNFV